MLARKLLVEGIFLVLLFSASVPFLTALGRWVEPRVAPVVSMAEFSQIDGRRYQVTFEKHRDCELIGVYWRITGNWVQQPFSKQFTRPPGAAFVAEWELPEQVDLSHNAAVSRHRCHGLWSTQTPFFEPNTRQQKELNDVR